MDIEVSFSINVLNLVNSRFQCSVLEDGSATGLGHVRWSYDREWKRSVGGVSSRNVA